MEEFDLKEYFIKDTFSTTTGGVKLFKENDLLSAQGGNLTIQQHTTKEECCKYFHLILKKGWYKAIGPF